MPPHHLESDRGIEKKPNYCAFIWSSISAATLYGFGSSLTVLSPTENSKKSRTFQGLRVIFQYFSGQI